MLKAAGNGYISDSYAKQLYSGGKPFTDELKSGFASTDRTQELITFFEENITDEEGVIIDFGIPEKTDCNKKALCVALTRQMQELINGTDDVDDILAMTYEAEKTNNSEEITGMESERALQQVIFSVMADNMELFKQFQDNPSFKKWLSDMVFNMTYDPKSGSKIVEYPQVKSTASMVAESPTPYGAEKE